MGRILPHAVTPDQRRPAAATRTGRSRARLGGVTDAARQTTLDRYEAARHYVDVELVRLAPRRKDPQGKVAAAHAFMAELGAPHTRYPSVQVAGTSGKGSVSALIAAACQEAGLRTGLHVTPYLQVFTEKTWVDGRLLSGDALAELVDEVRPVAERYRAQDDLPASVHGLTSLGLTYLAFAREPVELAVVETGVGGRYDLVQGLRRELSVITDLGLDHVQTLGSTLEAIAHHKAGIMEAGVPCVAVRGAGWDVLEAEARRVGAPLIGVVPEDLLAEADSGAVLRLPTLGDVPLDGAVGFARRNAAVAGRALDELAARGWPLRGEHLQRALTRRVLAGRRELLEGGRVTLDGAHNPQKLAALLGSLTPEPRTMVLGASGSRTPDELLAALAPRAKRVIACTTDLYGKQVVPAGELAQAARAAGVEAWAAPSPEAGVEEALTHPEPVLVTGSFYLIGRLRSRWYPWQEVLLQRTSWPSTRGRG
jgi:dihydrofolate synthase/folylpolyglutamate synthase